MKSKSKRGLLRACTVGFLLTLIGCSFFLFSGIALQNTVSVLHGSDRKVLDIQTADTDAPALYVTLVDQSYLVELKAANQAAKFLQNAYPLLPPGLRVLSYLLEGLREGEALLFS